MEFKEVYDIGELLASEQVDDFRHIELFTMDLVDKKYNGAAIIAKIKDNKKAMQKLGFICEIALEYASSTNKKNPQLDQMYHFLNNWRERSELEQNVLLTSADKPFKDVLVKNSNPKARKWGVLSDYSSRDFKKLQKAY